MAHAPSTVPGTSSRKAYCHPMASSSNGTSWMLSTVRANPRAVGAVSAVPTNRESAVSLNEVDKTPESAMTDAPHTAQNTTRTAGPAPKAMGDSRQQVPLTVSAATAAGERPSRSAANPPSRQPAAPTMPIVANTTSPADPGSAPAAGLASRNVGSQVQRA